MIYGIGIDIVKVERIKKAVLRWDRRFLERIFTENEILHAYKKRDPYLSLSARFAAKEALVKAIGGSIPVSMREIEILNLENGRPFMSVSGGMKAFFDEKMIRCSHISLSHEEEYGVACVVLEQ